MSTLAPRLWNVLPATKVGDAQFGVIDTSMSDEVQEPAVAASFHVYGVPLTSGPSVVDVVVRPVMVCGGSVLRVRSYPSAHVSGVAVHDRSALGVDPLQVRLAFRPDGGANGPFAW